MGFSNPSDMCEFDDAGVGKKDIDVAFLLLHRGIQPIQICEICHVTLKTGDVFADLFDC